MRNIKMICNKMKKESIDDYFSYNSTAILKTIRSKLWNNKTSNVISPGNMFSNVYLYVIERKDDLDSINELESYIFKYISNESWWRNGTNFKEERLISSDREVLDFDSPDEDDSVGREIQYNKWRYILTSFKMSLINQDAVLYDLYINKGINTSSKLARHLNISTTGAYYLIKAFRDKMNSFIESSKGDS